MSVHSTLETVLKVILFGVPALFIVLGFFVVIGGAQWEIISGNSGLKNVGITMMVIGITIYLVELIGYMSLP